MARLGRVAQQSESDAAPVGSTTRPRITPTFGATATRSALGAYFNATKRSSPSSR